jgi:alkanesulfonate monooxygenase SsuD/methylene tetrahydromethanopterin reductase-like flavin-dependent oxidoreductase (luciferase family)
VKLASGFPFLAGVALRRAQDRGDLAQVKARGAPVAGPRPPCYGSAADRNGGETSGMIQFGVFDHMDAPGEGPGALGGFFADRLRLIEAYDRAGFLGYHVAEHHATPLGLSPSPSVWLAAAAQRSARLRLGPLVYTLPLYHPLRLVEEICMLDQISGGRLMLGVGRGISPIELGYWGLDPAAAPAMYREALEVVLAGLAGGPLSYEGQFYQFRDVPIELAPVQRPHPPLWYGIGTPDGVPWAAAHRVNVVSNLPPAPMRAITERYRSEWAALGHPAAELPLIGLVRHVVVADSDAAALELARPAYHRWRTSFLKLWLKHGRMPSPHAIFPPHFDEAEADGRAVAGGPEKVAAYLRKVAATSGITYLLCRFAFGDMPVAAALRSVALFAAEVMPALAAD